MNKQAFTFLTLFTLILLLAVYYVTLPAETTQIQPEDLLASSESDPIEQYKDTKQKQDTQIRNQNEQVISSSTSSSEEKLEALNENAMMDAAKTMEKEIEALLNDNGFASCFVEKNNEIIRVVLPLEHQSQKSALTVMKLINQMLGEDLLVEVSFE